MFFYNFIILQRGNYMSSIFIFPGQGSQSVGMGHDLYENNASARAVFDEVDDALNEKLSDIIFNGPIDTLTLTSNVQPAIMATSIAMLRASGAELTEYVAGHSLGEYTALCAAGALSIGDTAKLLRLRGEAMQRAVPIGHGLTAVILGLDIDTVRDICSKTNCDVANDNCPLQVVVSGEKEIVEKTLELAKNAGAKRAMPLALSVPVHCRIQQPAADEMRMALEQTKILKPNAKIITNKTCQPMDDVDEIRAELVYQMTHGVRWRESILEMAKLGITETVEIGPGAVLTGLTKRICPEMNAVKMEI